MTKRAGGMVQGVGLEFIPMFQIHKMFSYAIKFV
jgi:hypothetical protein